MKVKMANSNAAYRCLRWGALRPQPDEPAGMNPENS